MQYIVDTHPHLDLELLPVTFTYPKSHAEVVRLAREAIDAANSDGTGRKVRLALVDSISSLPGVIVPWEELVELFHEKGVIALVDGAHQVGQLPVSIRKTKPDFFVSNAHKWLHAHRGVAIFYADKKCVRPLPGNDGLLLTSLCLQVATSRPLEPDRSLLRLERRLCQRALVVRNGRLVPLPFGRRRSRLSPGRPWR